MRLLRNLTIGYAAAVVPTVAASLAAIWIELRRIGDALDEVQDALQAVEANSQPFARHLSGLEAAVGRSAEEMGAAAKSLEHARTPAE